MKKYIVAVVLFSFVFAGTALAKHQTVKEVANKVSKGWYISQALHNNSTTAFPGVSYQKTVDEETNTVCYTAKFGNSISISCVK